LTAASEVTLALEGICREQDGVVGTVGRLEAFPNALNVVPGSVTLDMEIRSLRHDHFQRVVSVFQAALDRIREKRGVGIDFKSEITLNPVIFDSKMVERIRRICRGLDVPYKEMPSGAGHDASHISEIAPTGMLFIPSKGGRSHCPEEWSEFEHVCKGTEALACIAKAIDEEENH